jgi:hypothetical protein
VTHVKVTKALKMVVMPLAGGKMLREEQEELARYGEVAVPGEGSVTLPGGKVIVSYRESIKAGSERMKRSPSARRPPWWLRSDQREAESYWS